jgi:hypothetical protein
VVTRHSRLIDLLQFVRHDKNDLTDNIHTYTLTFFMTTTTGACRVFTQERSTVLSKKKRRKEKRNEYLFRSTFLHVNPVDKLRVLQQRKRKKKERQ